LWPSDMPRFSFAERLLLTLSAHLCGHEHLHSDFLHVVSERIQRVSGNYILKSRGRPFQGGWVKMGFFDSNKIVAKSGPLVGPTIDIASCGGLPVSTRYPIAFKDCRSTDTLPAALSLSGTQIPKIKAPPYVFADVWISQLALSNNFINW